MRSSTYPFNTVIKKYDYLQDIEIDGKKGESGIYSLDKFICGYTLGEPLPTFKVSEDPELRRTKELLTQVSVKDTDKVLKIESEHKNTVVIDNSNTKCDGMISTKGAPIMLPVADCCAFAFIHQPTNIFGLCHAGRAEIGHDIGTVFSNIFKDLINQKGGNFEEVKIFLAPHIFGFEKPHSNNQFMYHEDGSLNWWGLNQEFAPLTEGIWYPDFAAAAIYQIRNVLVSNLSITACGLSTFQGYGYSYSKRKDNMLNAVFLGIKS